MYLEMLQQKYGAGLEKRSAAFAGNVLRRLGRGMVNPKLRNWIATKLRNLGSSTYRVGDRLIDRASSTLGRTAGYALRDLGKVMRSPNLRNRITTGLRGAGRTTHRIGNMLRNNPKAQLGFTVGTAAGVGGSALADTAGYNLYRPLKTPEHNIADLQLDKPKTYIPDTDKSALITNTTAEV